MQNQPVRQKSSSSEEQSSSLYGDHIGLESCVDLRDDADNDEVEEEETLSSGRNGGGGGIGEMCGRREMKTKNKEFPPAIPWLAQTGNLLSHMPWIMRRYHTSDGRLVITVEKVKHHEYFRAHRANGRLTLHLVPMDDDFYEEEEKLEEDDDSDDDDEGNAEDGGSAAGGETEEAEAEAEKGKDEKESAKSACVDEMKGNGGSAAGGGGGANCCMRSISSCMLGMAVSAIKPVQI